MSEIAVPRTTPELTPEHKTQVLLLQRQILTLQVTLQNTQKQLEQMGPSLNLLLNKILEDLKSDPKDYTFDLDSLKLLPKV